MNDSAAYILISQELLHDIFQRFLNREFVVLTEENGVKYKIFVREDSRIYDLPNFTEAYCGLDKTTIFFFGTSDLHRETSDSCREIVPIIVKEEIKE